MAAETTQGEAAGKVPLDDVMMAMDVVDTLRHDVRIAERELNDEARRSDLIRRLRELYRGQGIEVPDHILEEGVRALEEERFVYKPPRDGLAVRVARIYVSRHEWGRYLLGAMLVVMVLWASWQLLIERPRVQRAENLRIELSEKLPGRLSSLVSQIKAETSAATVVSQAERTRDDGLRAARAGEINTARSAERTLARMLETLRAEYEIRIVTRKGEQSGVWREPRVNQTARNYYVVVEARDANGRVLRREITNEETGKTEQVKIWAVRVPERVWAAVKADKLDDGIIENAVIGRKVRGKMKPDWLVEVSGGAITSW